MEERDWPCLIGTVAVWQTFGSVPRKNTTMEGLYGPLRKIVMGKEHEEAN